MERITLRPGPEEANYTTQLVVDIANDLGAIEKVFLEVQAVQRTLTTDEMSELVGGVISRLGEGSVQEAMQIAMSAAASLNTNSDSKDTSNQPTTTLASVEEANNSRKQLRATAVAGVSLVKAKTVDSVKQSGCTIAALTESSDEISSDTQTTAMGFVSGVTDTLKQYTDGSHGETPSVEDTISSARCIVASMANVGEAAQKSFQSSIKTANEVFGQHNESHEIDYDLPVTTLMSMMYELSTTTESPVTATEVAATAAALEAAVDAVRDVSRNAHIASNAIAGSLLTSQAPGQPPVVLKAKSFELQAERELVETAGNSTSRTQDGSFKMPSIGNILGNKSVDFIDKKI